MAPNHEGGGEGCQLSAGLPAPDGQDDLAAPKTPWVLPRRMYLASEPPDDDSCFLVEGTLSRLPCEDSLDAHGADAE